MKKQVKFEVNDKIYDKFRKKVIDNKTNIKNTLTKLMKQYTKGNR